MRTPWWSCEAASTSTSSTSTALRRWRRRAAPRAAGEQLQMQQCFGARRSWLGGQQQQLWREGDPSAVQQQCGRALARTARIITQKTGLVDGASAHNSGCTLNLAGWRWLPVSAAQAPSALLSDSSRLLACGLAVPCAAGSRDWGQARCWVGGCISAGLVGVWCPVCLWVAGWWGGSSPVW